MSVNELTSDTCGEPGGAREKRVEKISDEMDKSTSNLM